MSLILGRLLVKAQGHIQSKSDVQCPEQAALQPDMQTRSMTRLTSSSCLGGDGSLFSFFSRARISKYLLCSGSTPVSAEHVPPSASQPRHAHAHTHTLQSST